MEDFTNKDLEFLREAIKVAKNAKTKGNLPFGCLLVDESNQIIALGENSIVTDRDNLAHAEINLIRAVSGKYDFEFLKKCTIYTSDEPCPMCAAAIFWGGIGKLVYGLSKRKYYEITGRSNPDYDFEIPCREILDRGARKVLVKGPLLEEEAAMLHRN